MKPHVIQPISIRGSWRTDFGRHFESAYHSLVELRSLQAELDASRPPGSPKRLASEEITPEVYRAYRRRDRLATSVVIFSAMSVEAYLNFYGVVRVGEDLYQRQFERMSFDRKLEVLLFVCNGLAVEKGDPIADTIRRVADRRNALVHPKTREAGSPAGERLAEGIAMPHAAEEAFRDCEKFFELFQETVPEARLHLDRLNTIKAAATPS